LLGSLAHALKATLRASWTLMVAFRAFRVGCFGDGEGVPVAGKPVSPELKGVTRKSIL
jgi:hypothetical protein